MDITTILGIVIGAGFIIFGIKFPNLGNFFDPGSIIIVLGGTLAAIIASYPVRMLKEIPKHAKLLFGGKKYNPESLIATMVELAQLARKSGLLALEEKANEMTDPFFKRALLLVVDAMEAEKIKEILDNELDELASRHEESIGIYTKGSAMAPAFGMIGTLIGLINMLKNMNLEEGGASSIGGDMSVALVTTFYGCILANLIFMPIAEKLKVRNEEELLYKQLIVTGVLSIQYGDNPKFLEEKLLSHLSQQKQNKMSGGSGEEGEGKGKGKGKKEKKPKKEK